MGKDKLGLSPFSLPDLNKIKKIEALVVSSEEQCSQADIFPIPVLDKITDPPFGNLKGLK